MSLRRFSQILLFVQLIVSAFAVGSVSMSLSPVGCIDNDVICSSMVGQLSTSECTRYFRQCSNGEWLDPQEVARGTYCYRGNQVSSDICKQRASSSCSFSGIQCVDGDQNPITTHCTSHYQTCNDGTLSNVMGTEGMPFSVFLPQMDSPATRAR